MRSSANAEENLARAAKKIREAAARGAQIICLHELSAPSISAAKKMPICSRLPSQFPVQPPKPWRKVARETQAALIVSLFERRAAGVYHNSAVVIDADGSLLGRYRKMHIPDDPLYYEKFYFTPGDLGFLSSTRAMRASAFRSAGTNGIRKARAW